MDRHASANRPSPPIASAGGGQTLAVEVNGLVTKIDDSIIHDGLNLALPAGEVLGLVGETGGGKSIFLETLIGLRRPLAGSIRVFGQDPYDVAKNGTADIRRTWGVLFQSGALFSNLTVLENVAFVAREQANLSEELSYSLAAIKIQMCGLESDAFHLMPSELSGGMRKRAALARALVLDPKLLILDEPTSGLDPVEASHVDTLISELCRVLGLTALLITHDLDTLYSVCDRVAVLADRRIIATGTIDELKRNSYPWIRQYFLGSRGTAAFRAHRASAAVQR
jgi:phospholipid/cholesterol/gamma-HCH transport system ATP-binding protein